MDNQQAGVRRLSTAAWFAYGAIVFEILYMISPFAMYYYSLYAPPLRFFQAHEMTAFLTLNILPHFSNHNSAIITTLHLVSWPMIAAGAVLFLAAAGQIYWSKFTGRQVVMVGLYKIIRHPQYVALALVGLGCTLFWPRFISYLMYVTMLFLYYLLAKAEEAACLEQFGDSYRDYQSRTGMFLLKSMEDRLLAIPPLLPAAGGLRLVVLAALYVLYAGVAVAFGFMVRDFAVGRVVALASDDLAVISVAPLPHDTLVRAVDVATSDSTVQKVLMDRNVRKTLLYVIPTEWSIPELGMTGSAKQEDFLFHPGTHGNRTGFDRSHLIVLVTRPLPASLSMGGRDIVKRSVSFDPLMEVLVDINRGIVLRRSPRERRGEWDGVPVPVF